MKLSPEVIQACAVYLALSVVIAIFFANWFSGDKDE